MSVGFGFSVGDFLAVLKLVGTVIDALRESSNASSSFRSLINELYVLESALLRVKRLDLEISHVSKVALQQAASQCQQTMETFYAKIQKYQPHLQQGGTASKMKDAWAKIKWATCKKDDVETFRAEIRGHTSSIEILLLAMQMEVTEINTRKQGTQHKSLAKGIQDLSFQAIGRLATIASCVAQSVQQGKALLESSAQIVSTNLRVFQVVHDIQLFILKIPGQVQRQQPVYLIDPLNKECPFHLEFVRSSEALLAVLKINLKESGCGPAMIDRGEFAIEELGTQSSIDLTGSWDSCFYPGQRVGMSMIFKQWQGNDQSSCPRCGKEHDESGGKEITCNACGIMFRRIEKVIEEMQDTWQHNHFAGELDPNDMGEGSAHGPKPLRKKRKIENALTNLRKFRRIQLIGQSPGGSGKTLSRQSSMIRPSSQHGTAPSGYPSYGYGNGVPSKRPALSSMDSSVMKYPLQPPGEADRRKKEEDARQAGAKRQAQVDGEAQKQRDMEPNRQKAEIQEQLRQLPRQLMLMQQKLLLQSQMRQSEAALRAAQVEQAARRYRGDH